MFRLFRSDKPFFPRLSKLDVTVLIAGVALYAGLAASTITKFSVWFDEAFGSFIVRYSFVDLTRYTANDVHPPLYYWFLKVWTTMFGNTEIGIRSMSVFFGLVTIVFVFLLVVKLFGRRAAYVTLAFLVLSPMFIRYGQEARMYTLLTAIVVAATYVLVYATETKKRWAWITYGVLLALGMLTQYFAALAWLAHLAWRFVTVRVGSEPVKKTLRRVLDRQMLTAYGTSLLLFAFWLPFLVMQFLTVQGHGFWIKPVSTATVPDFLTKYLFFSEHDGVLSWLALAFYLLVIMFVYLAVRLLKTLEAREKRNYLLVLFLTIVPVVILVVMSMPPLRSAFVDRYLMTTVVFLSILAGVTLVLSSKLMPRTVRWAAGIVIAACMIVGITNQMTVGNYNRASGQSNNVRQLLESVRAQTTAGTPILASSPWVFYEASIYNRPDSPIYYVDETTEYKYGSLTALAENGGFKIKNLDEFAGKHDDLWVIANLRDVPPRALRANWTEKQSVTVNDDLTGKPLFKATRFSVE